MAPLLLVSNRDLKEADVIPKYYTRQSAERLFSYLKTDLDLLPLRVHSESNLRGYLMVNFVALIIFTPLQNKFKKQIPTEEALFLLRNLKCKIYDNKRVPQEITKGQRELLEVAGINIMTIIAGV